jgi:hypothetical protein
LIGLWFGLPRNQQAHEEQRNYYPPGDHCLRF